MQWRDENGNLCIGIKPDVVKTASGAEPEQVEKPEPKKPKPPKEGKEK